MHGLPSGEIPVVPHVGWSNLYLEELLPKLSIPKAPRENNTDDKIYNRSVDLECHRCNHANDTVRNKKRCFSCRSWKDRIAPLSASARGVVLDNKAGVELRVDGIDRSIDEPPAAAAAATVGRGGVT